MCWACEEDALWRRYQLEVAVRDGEIPPGFEPEDFEAEGLPVPPRRAKPVDGDSDTGRSQDSGNPEILSLGPRVRGDERKAASEPTNPFACDAPDEK